MSQSDASPPSDLLDLAVDRASEVPLGTQLIWKLRRLIATGLLGPGDRLPGIREVADLAGVNVNTVRSVFARLEEQALLVSHHGRGTFVASDVHAATVLADMAHAAIAQARAAGIDPRELAAALYVSPELSSEDHELAQRRSLRANIARLEGELASLDPIGTLEQRSETPAPRLLTVAELRQIRDDLERRIGDLRVEREQWRVENEQLEAAQDDAATVPRPARWRHAGVWTGHPATVSWTVP